ncbi:PAC2 family protein [soil metagenome]
MSKPDPHELYELEPDLPQLDGPVLVQAMDGFVDAGSARRLAREQLLQAHGSRVVATFDVDALLDYRARRPLMTFDEDHWAHYADPQLAVHLAHDAQGTPFLVLAGPEPDIRWEAFTVAVTTLVAELGVSTTVGLNAIPMAVPHTRPLGIIAHASRPELVAGHERWVGTVQVPSTAGHLLEYRLGQAGRDAAGFAVAVPHYLAEAEYPPAALALLGSVSALTGLSFELDTAGVTVRAQVD